MTENIDDLVAKLKADGLLPDWQTFYETGELIGRRPSEGPGQRLSLADPRNSGISPEGIIAMNGVYGS